MPQEVEVKLRLANGAAHQTLLNSLKEHQSRVYNQENFFFDGDAGQLSAARCVLRVRFYNETEKAVITVKGQMVVDGGVGRAQENEEDVDPVQARKFVEDPDVLLSSGSSLIQGLVTQFGVKGFVCLGGFKNIRKVCNWDSLVLEVDETVYEWGTVYELECETDAPEVALPKIEKFLRSEGVDFRHSTTTKFANFIKRSLD